MSHIGGSFFNPTAPTQSLATFIDRSAILTHEQKSLFIEMLEAFFAEKAYKGEHLEFISEIWEDLRALGKIAIQAKLQVREHRMWQLFANVLKVSQQSLPSDKLSEPIYQIILQDHLEKYWGWIHGQYVSDKLLGLVKDGTIYIVDPQCTPSMLTALQRLHTFKARQGCSENPLDLSFDMLLDLVIFAGLWHVKSLQQDLCEIFKLLSLSMNDPKQKEEFAYAKLRAAPSLVSYLQELGIDSNGCMKEVSTPKLALKIQEETTSTPSRWFDEKYPSTSLIDFAKANCTLSLAEQYRFHATVKSYFAKAGYQDRVSPHSFHSAQRFECISVVFLLNTMQHRQVERHRFLATVQMESGCFFKTHASDCIRIVRNEYGTNKRIQIAWVQAEKWEAPLQITSKARLSFLEDGELGTAEQVVALLAVGHAHSVSPWIVKGQKDLTRGLANPQMRSAFSTELARYAHLPWVKEYFAKNSSVRAAVNSTQLTPMEQSHLAQEKAFKKPPDSV